MKLNTLNTIKYIAATTLSILFINIGSISFASAAISNANLFDLTNATRSQNNISSLSLNDKLTTAALNKANDMFANGYFAHTSPSGKTPWSFIKDAGYDYAYAGENLAIGYSDTNELQTAWMNSPTHKENIVNPNYREIGIASVDGTYEGAKTTIVVVEFGSTTFTVPAVASANQNAGFSIDSTKTSFSPTKIFANEQVTFTTNITGDVTKAYFQVGDQTIELDKDYKSTTKINKTGEVPVNLIVIDKSGEKHTQTIGTLTVLPTTITKNDTSAINQISNHYPLAISIIVLIALAFGYVLLRKKKVQIPVFRMN